MADASELVGSRVIVRNPNRSSSWEGRAIGYADHPVILIETDDGRRLMLPAAWATPTEETA